MAKKTFTSEVVDRVMRDSLRPVLSPLGFRKTGRCFHRAVGEVTQVVALQSSQWSDQVRGFFTVNLNVVLPAFHEVWTGTAMPKNPGAAAEICAYRIGDFMEEGRDMWWELVLDSDPVAIGSEVAEAVETCGLPVLEEAGDPEWVLEKLLAEEHFRGYNGNQKLAGAVLLAVLGRKLEAMEVIRVLRAMNRYEGFVKTIDCIEGRIEGMKGVG